MTLYRRQLGTGPHLVLLHGWGMNAAVWEPLLPQLAARYTVTVLELPGHGASAPAAAADLSIWAGLCLDAAPDEALWLGWSLGGQVALRAASMAPARIKGLTLVATTPRFVQDEGWACAMRVATFRQFADALDADPQATLLRFLALQVKGDDHAHGTLRLLRTELAQRPAASRAGLRQGLDLLLANDLRDELAALDCPQHWWFGARDTLVPAAAAAAVRTLAPAAEVRLIAGAGHAPCLSHPHDCLEGLGCPPGVAHGHG